MNTPKDQHSNQSPEEMQLSEDKELWDLLDNVSKEEASPLFSRNVMREIRLEDDKSPSNQPFWQRFSRFLLLGAGALGATALLSVMLWNLNSHSADDTPLADGEQNTEILAAEVATSLESSLESELLLAAADEPELFSDEEVIAMLF